MPEPSIGRRFELNLLEFLFAVFEDGDVFGHEFFGLKEELKIEAGADTISICGKGLVRLAEALDDGALEIVTERVSESATSPDNAIIVDTLVVEKVV